jgi:SNF2 family DNA or RNA helicase
MLADTTVLSPAQVRTVALMCEMEASEMKGGANAHVPGMGKTLMCLALVARKWTPGAAKKTLFLVPPGLVKQYIAENAKFTKLTSAMELPQSPAMPSADITVLSAYEVLSPKFRFDIVWDRVFIDECHEFRNEAAQRVKRAMLIEAEFRWALSGTFLINSSVDLYAVCQFLRLKVGRETRFRSLMRSGSVVRRVVIQSTAEEIADLQLTSAVQEISRCVLTETEAAKYAVCVRAARRTAAMLMKMRHEMRMLAANCEDKLSRVRRAILVVLRDHPGEKIIVFTSYRSTMQTYVDWFTRKNVPVLSYSGTHSMKTREATVQLFNNSAVHRLLFIGFQCGNSGINLQVANHVILNEPVWNEALNEQAIARSLRKGQAREVHVTRFVTERTIEEQMYLLAQKKKEEIARAYARGQVV